MKLTGIEIEVDGQSRCVGKVGLCPHGSEITNRIHNHVRGQPIFYREAPFAQVFSYETSAISVDAMAWDKAAALGAQFMVIFCKDIGRIYVAPKDLIGGAGKVDLGENPQYRIKPTNCIAIKSSIGINMGYTKNVAKAGIARETLKEKWSAHLPGTLKQGRLF